MTKTETPRVFGRPVAEAAAALASTDGPDPATVEEEIALFVEDGIVSRDRVDEAVAGLAKVVSTPETRVEVAAREVDRAHEAAADAADLGVVAHRLDALDERLAAVETEVRTLGGRLSAVLDDAKDPAALYETARAVRALTDDANAAQLAADSLRDDAEATVEWARAHETRSREFGDDVAAVAESVDGVAAAVEWLSGDADDPPDSVERADPGLVWAEASVGVRVADLLIADLRAELADLRTWAGREGLGPVLGDEESDLDALADRRDRLADRLDDVARPAWRDAHGDRVARAETTVASFDPPAEWDAVRAALDDT
ncbi:MAG: halo transducer protein [Haloferacaceae archaeon]